MDNPLLFYSGTPLFKKIQPEHIVPAATTVFEDVERSFDRLEAHLSGGGGRKWEEIFDPLDDMGRRGLCGGLCGQLSLPVVYGFVGY